jgi:two-component system phosphate regulon sensor histidine kinase PhoR
MRQEYLGYILQECERMTGIISDILLLERQSRLEVSTQTLLDVRQIADQVAASLAPQTAKRDISIEVSGQMRLRGEESDLWELLRNLMSNAVRYGVNGGWVKVQLSPHTLVVADNGIGIDQKHIGRLFEKFYRVDDSRHREDGGTGLGLAIVAAIINRYGATIHLDSVPGEGSRFTVQFPTA